MGREPLPGEQKGETSHQNLLLVTYSFPPLGGVGVHRALSLARYLPEFGWNVHVLTARNPSAVGTDLRLLEQVPKSVTIHRTFAPDLPFRLKKAVKKRAGATSADSPRAVPGGLVSSAVQTVKDTLSPDPQVLWLPFAARAAERIVKECGIEVMLVTVPPFSSLRLTTSLKRKFPKLTVISDIRDEWLTYYFHTLGYNRSARAFREAKQIEHNCVESSTLIVMVTEKAREEMLHRYPNERADKFAVIGNGYEPEIFRDFRPRANSGEHVLLGYTGTVYAPSDPTPFVKALELLPENLRSRLRVRFIGHVENPEYRSMLERHSPVVQLDGFVPQADAMKALETMDFLLLIWNDAINIPGKLYDYLGTGKPILACAHPDGEVRRLIATTRSGWCANTASPSDIAELLTRVCERKTEMLAEFDPDHAQVRRCERSQRAREYSQLIRSALRAN
jgi:glycosyltransferase involved in cell wall biosynthesis